MGTVICQAGAASPGARNPSSRQLLWHQNGASDWTKSHVCASIDVPSGRRRIVFANIKSAVKRIKSSEKKRVRNQRIRSYTRSSVKKARRLINEGNKEEAQAAITGLNGQDLHGQTLNVNEARPRTDKGGGGRGGRRYNSW